MIGKLLEVGHNEFPEALRNIGLGEIGVVIGSDMWYDIL